MRRLRGRYLILCRRDVVLGLHGQYVVLVGLSVVHSVRDMRGGQLRVNRVLGNGQHCVLAVRGQHVVCRGRCIV